MEEYFKEVGYEITRLIEGSAPLLQRFLEQCDDYFNLVEGKPAIPTAAVDELTGGPPERLPDDLFCFGIRISSGEIVGILSAFRDHRRERQWYLSFLLIHPTLRRRRLGRTIYLAFEAWVRSQRADSIRLAVVEANHAGARFWKSLGFVHRTSFPEMKIGLREHLLFEFEKLID